MSVWFCGNLTLVILYLHVVFTDVDWLTSNQWSN